MSTFARVGALPLVARLMQETCLHVSPGTYHELRKAIEAGCSFLEPILDAIHSGQELDLLELTRPEILSIKDLPSSLGAGEAESIALCLNRPGTYFLTNDKRARNFCRERGIPCLDLPEILRALWVRKALPKKKARELVRRIETEQGLVIKNKDEIFK